MSDQKKYQKQYYEKVKAYRENYKLNMLEQTRQALMKELNIGE